MIVFESAFTHIEFREKNNLFIVTRTLPNNVSNEEYKEDVLLWAKQYEKYKPEVQIVDMKKNFFPVELKLQSWLDEKLVKPASKAGLKYVAFVCAEEFFTELSHQQIMDLQYGKTLTVKYYDKYYDAISWSVEMSSKHALN